MGVTFFDQWANKTENFIKEKENGRTLFSSRAIPRTKSSSIHSLRAEMFRSGCL